MSLTIEAQVAASIQDFRFAEAGLHELLQGPVMQDLTFRAIRVESSAKAHARGRPGPRVRSGRLWGSITWRLGHDAVSPYADIGSAVEYARRIELGFVGEDSLGRRYNQPAFPYLRPGLEAARVGM